MIFTIIIPSDMDWLIRLVSDFIKLVKMSQKDGKERIITSEIKQEENKDDTQDS